MPFTNRNTAMALALISGAFAIAPAQAVQVSLFGGSNPGNLTSVTGVDPLGNTWQTSNGAMALSSSFAMADVNAAPQTFNSANFNNSLGTFATSFQLTINNSQRGSGFGGINQGVVASGLTNNLTVKPNLLDASTWVVWTPSFNLVDAGPGGNGLFQQILFTAPTGQSLTLGTNFSMNVNFAGIMTADSGWAASWSDRAPQTTVIPVPGSLPLLGLGLMGLIAAGRRAKTARASGAL